MNPTNPASLEETIRAMTTSEVHRLSVLVRTEPIIQKLFDQEKIDINAIYADKWIKRPADGTPRPSQEHIEAAHQRMRHQMGEAVAKLKFETITSTVCTSCDLAESNQG